MNLRDHLIVALDLPDFKEVLHLVDTLGDEVLYYKIGSHLFTKYGHDILSELMARDKEIFLDLKYHDIPSVIGKTISEVRDFPNVFMTTVHAAGGKRMMQEAAKAAGDSLNVVAVTGLTSDKNKMSYPDALSLTYDALEEGLDGIVCPPSYLAYLRLNIDPEECGMVKDPLYITPGIRPPFTTVKGDDQVHTSSSKEALVNGSSFIVVGRPIYQSDDPKSVVSRIKETLN